MVVPFREEMAKRHLKVTGDLGRVVFMVKYIRNWVVGDDLKSGRSGIRFTKYSLS